MKYSEIVKSLRVCAASVQDYECDGCSYREAGDCTGKLKHDAAIAIEILQQIADNFEQAAKDNWKEACEYKEQLPKQGEWIPIQIGKWRGHKCSCCGTAREVPCSSSDGIPQWKYCVECGAKMGVQDANT